MSRLLPAALVLAAMAGGQVAGADSARQVASEFVTAVATTQARSAQDAIFLRELKLNDGWHVVAAGCQAQEGGEPYQCVLQGS